MTATTASGHPAQGSAADGRSSRGRGADGHPRRPRRAGRPSAVARSRAAPLLFLLPAFAVYAAFALYPQIGRAHV